MKQTRAVKAERRQLPHAALLVLAVMLTGVVFYLVWPWQKVVTCDSLLELTALAVLAAALFVFAARSLAHAMRHGEERRIAGGALILAALSLFLSVRFIVTYRAPCTAVQHQLKGR